MKIVSSFLPPCSDAAFCKQKQQVNNAQKQAEQAQTSQQKLAEGSAVARQSVPQTNQSEQKQSSTRHSQQNLQNSRDGVTLENLTEAEKQLIMELRARDREVRQHEQQHRAAAGSLVRGSIKYDYQTGPDGRRYAIGGEISIDTAPEGTPEETIKKAQKILQAASAPAEPSPQDRRVAAEARQMLVQAEQALAEQRIAEQNRQSSDPVIEEASTATTDDESDAVELPQWIEDEETPTINSALFDTSGQEILDLIQQSQDQQKADMPDTYANSVLMTPPKYSVGIKMMMDVQNISSAGELVLQGGNLDLFA